MNSTSATHANTHFNAPSTFQQDIQRDSSSAHARPVDTLSDKAAKEASAAENSERASRRSPSAVFIRSEERYESSYSVTTLRTGSADRVTPEKSASDVAAGNILGFIENQLSRDLADGASEEELTSRIEAGLEGFLKGFAQARDELEDAGLLSDDVSDDIQLTYDKVLAGVEALKAEYLGEQAVSQDSEPESSEVRPDTVVASAYESRSNSSSRVNVSPVEPAEAAGRSDGVARAESLYAMNEVVNKNSFSFSVTTQDGDKVTINSSSLQAILEEGARRSSGRGVAESYSYSSFQENNFALQIDGSLDKGEMEALTDLLSQVNDLAESFFAGDMEAAFNNALSLGYDSSEISGFALNLSQTSVQRAAVAYQQEPAAESSLANSLKPIGGFAQGLLDAVKTAEAFQMPQELIATIAEQIEQSRPEQGFKSFVERMLESLPA